MYATTCTCMQVLGIQAQVLNPVWQMLYTEASCHSRMKQQKMLYHTWEAGKSKFRVQSISTHNSVSFPVSQLMSTLCIYKNPKTFHGFPRETK